jgi:hypothetical protein
MSLPQPPLRKPCGAKNRNCRKCNRRFNKEESSLLNCPICNEPRLCIQTRTYANGRCKNHGGPTPRGIASASFKHGMSKGGLRQAIGVNNPRQQQLYDEYLRAEETRDHTTSMALFASRRDVLLEGMKGAEFYKSIEDALNEFEEAMKPPINKARTDTAFSVLRTLIKQGGEEARRWQEVYGLEEKLGKARERQDKREITQRMMIPLAEFYIARGQFVEIVKQAIDQINDKETRALVLGRIQRDIERAAQVIELEAVSEDLGVIG